MLRQERFSRSCVAGADGSVCDSSVRERAWFVVFLHGDLRSDGLILLLDRELRRIVRWRGSDTGSWRCQDSRIPGRRLFFFPQWPVERPCKRGRRLEAVRDANNAPTHNTAISGKLASISLHAAAVA